MRNGQKILILLIIGVFCLSHDLVAQDSVRVTRSERHFRPEPLKATMLAVAFPGLGQVYNRKYWKIPLVYAGFAALFYSVSFNSSGYNKMIKAYQDFTDNIPATDSYIPLITGAEPSQYDPVLFPNTYNPSTASWVSTNLLNSVDYYKKYRDLSYIGIAAWYLVTILDANVDASLFDFDVNKNLNLTLYPMHTPLPGGIGAGLSVSLIYTF